MKRTSLNIPDPVLERINAIRSIYGYDSTTVIIVSINEFYDNMMKGKPVRHTKETKDNAINTFCLALGGVIEGNECVYKTYNMQNEYTQRVDLSLLNAEYVEIALKNMYYPDKATVLKLREKAGVQTVTGKKKKT